MSNKERETINPDSTDDQLLALIIKGDQNAYSMLVKRYLPKIWRLSISILKNEQEAEDASQDVFLSLWQSLQKWDLNGKAKFSTWIYRVAFNKCIDIKRKQKPAEDSDGLEITSGEDSAYQVTLQNQLSSKLLGLMTALPDMQCEALKFYYYEELSVEEISNKMEKSEDSVRSLLKRGRAALKEKMQYDESFHSWDISGLSRQLWRMNE